MKFNLDFYGTQAELRLEAETVTEAAQLFKLPLQAKNNGVEVCAISTSDDHFVCTVVLPLKKSQKTYITNRE